MMLAPHLSGKMPPRRQSRRVSAHSGCETASPYACALQSCQRFDADRCSSKRRPATCQHRYPSPCRSVLSQNRPVILFAKPPVSAAKRHFFNFGIEASAERRDSCSVRKINKGSIQCLRLQQFSHLPQPSASAHAPASTPTANAHLLVQALVRSQPAQPVATPQPVPLAVPLLARFATTSTSAVKAEVSGQACRNVGLTDPSLRMGLARTAQQSEYQAYFNTFGGTALCFALHSNPQHFLRLSHSRPARRPLSHQRQWPQKLRPWQKRQQPLRLSATTANAPCQAANSRAITAHTQPVTRRLGASRAAFSCLKDQ